MSQTESAHVRNSYTWARHGNSEMCQRWLTFGLIEPEHSRVSRHLAAIRPSALASVGLKKKIAMRGPLSLRGPPTVTGGAAGVISTGLAQYMFYYENNKFYMFRPTDFKLNMFDDANDL